MSRPSWFSMELSPDDWPQTVTWSLSTSTIRERWAPLEMRSEKKGEKRYFPDGGRPPAKEGEEENPELVHRGPNGARWAW